MTENLRAHRQGEMNKPDVVYPFDGIVLIMRKKPGVHSTAYYISKPVYNGKISQTKD